MRHTYSVEAMADDAVSVLDGVGLDRAHVYGFSMGGMVAQSLALRHPDRIQSLVLGATHAGGRRAVLPDQDVMAFFNRRLTMETEEAAWASVAYNYGPRCRDHGVDRIAEDIERRLEHPFNRGAYKAQLYAAAMHNCHGRLRRIGVPTMVVHGAARSNHPRLQRAHDGRRASRTAGCGSSRSRAISTRPRSPRSTRRSPPSSQGGPDRTARVEHRRSEREVCLN